MTDVYRTFAEPWAHVLDMSDQALVDMYNHETHGTTVSDKNGYACGKK